MFLLIDRLPSFAVGIIAKGHITEDDFKTTLLPALRKATAEWKAVNLLFVMETNFTDFSPGAWLQDIKVNTQFFLKWNKVAMVSEKAALDAVTRVFSIIVPGEARTFGLAELEAAKRWISSL